MVDEKSDKSFWTSLPGILTGLAALITAIGGILWYIYGGGITPGIVFEASPNSITLGDSVTLSWTVTNAESVSIDPGVSSTTNAGIQKVSPKETTTYTLTAKSKDKVASRSIQVVVREIPTPEIVSFEAQPKAITSGNSAELIWTVTNAESVSIDPGVSSTTNAGIQKVSPKETTTYTLTAKNKDKVASKSTQVVVNLIFDFLDPSLDGWNRTGTSIPWKTLSDSVAWHETWGVATGVVVMDSCHKPSANIDTSCGIEKSIHIPSTATNLIASILKIGEDGAMTFKLIDSQSNEIMLGTEYLVGNEKKTVSYSIKPWAGQDVTLKIMSIGWGGVPTPSCPADTNACCGEYIGLDKVEIV